MAKAVQFFYKINPTTDLDMFSVHKLDADLELLNSYHTTSSRFGKPRCDCPSRKRPCKHVSMVNRFLAAGSPLDKAINSMTNQFETITSLE